MKRSYFNLLVLVCAIAMGVLSMSIGRAFAAGDGGMKDGQVWHVDSDKTDYGEIFPVKRVLEP